jgi:hypothetical protein
MIFSIYWANAGPQQPTKANTGQHSSPNILWHLLRHPQVLKRTYEQLYARFFFFLWVLVFVLFKNIYYIHIT